MLGLGRIINAVREARAESEIEGIKTKLQVEHIRVKATRAEAAASAAEAAYLEVKAKSIYSTVDSTVGGDDNGNNRHSEKGTTKTTGGKSSKNGGRKSTRKGA